MKKKKAPRNKKINPSEFLKLDRYLSIVISIFSLAVSFFALLASYESKPLAYYAVPMITSASDRSILWNLEIIVTNGAAGDIRVPDYSAGQITEIANNVGGTIRKESGKGRRTFQFRLDYGSYEQEKFYATVYVLVHGKDGSQHVDMVLFDIDTSSGKVQVQYYSPEDLLFAEMDPEQTIYAGALSSYRQLLEVLKANNL